MKKTDIEQIGALYEQISFGEPGGGDKYCPTMGRGGYGVRVTPEEKRDPDEYNDGYDDDEDGPDDYFDYGSCMFKKNTFQRNPSSIKAHTTLIDEVDNNKSISFDRFWELFSVMYSLTEKDTPHSNFFKVAIRCAVYKVNQDFPDMSLEASLPGEGSVYKKES